MARTFDDIVRDATSLSAMEQQQQQQQRQQQQEAAQTGAAIGGTLGEALAPVLQAEKTDAMFWLLVAQTFLLYLIWRKI